MYDTLRTPPSLVSNTNTKKAPAGKYACTFEGCYTSFDRAAWEQHEKTNHSQMELWKCTLGPCAHKSFRPDSYANHLASHHKITNEATIATKVAEGHVGVGSFWCGFCYRVVQTGELKWDHVGAHFAGGALIENYVWI